MRPQERITNEPGALTSLSNLLNCPDAESVRYAVRGLANLARGAGRTSLSSQPGMLSKLQVAAACIPRLFRFDCRFAGVA
jgi:hypothetical protein